MTSTSFALTKIEPPRARGHLVSRPTLERRLGEALATRRLTVLSAPAGFGKTAALTRQIELLPPNTALAWIAADEDDDLHRFLTCLVAALEAFDLPWRTSPDAWVASAVNSPADRRAIAGELLNALDASDAPRGLIVVDDAHRIADPAVFEFLDLLLERLPECWGLVIGSRVDPPLALARLRAQNELAEVRQAELRFDREEIAALVAAGGSPDAVSEAEVTHLLARTRGWAAGLRLTLSTSRSGPSGAQGRSARALDRHVFEYLAAEVLDDMSEELRTFLMRCSVLPQLTAARCAVVSGNPRAAQLLDEVERRDLFVSVIEGQELALTLHELFRECLYERLRREHAGEVPQLLRLAAQTEPDLIRRLSFLLSAGAWQDAEAALDEVAKELLSGGVVEPVTRLIAQFPTERRSCSPAIALVRAITAWERWDWHEMLDATRVAVTGFSNEGDEPRRQRALVLEAIALTGSGWTERSAAKLSELPLDASEPETRALARALLAWHALDTGDLGAVAQRYAALMDELEKLDTLQVWYWGFKRPLYVRLPGIRAPLTRYVAGVMRRISDAPTQIRAIANVAAAWLALWRGDLDEAMTLSAAAEAEARWFGMPTHLRTFLHTFQAAAHAVRGDRDAAMAAVHALVAEFDRQAQAAYRVGRTSMQGHYVFFGLRIADTAGDAESVRAFAARMPRPEQITNAPMLRGPLLTVPARLAAIEGRHEEACRHWERALEDETAIDIIGQAAEARARYAASLLALGRRAEAAATLRPLIEEAAASGEIGGALLAGRDVLSRLASATWRDELRSTEIAALRNWARLVQASPEARPAPIGDDPLTAREREILQRIAAGDTNKLIARAFDLSPHTVKRHVANILDKLGLASRGQAAEWYRSHARD